MIQRVASLARSMTSFGEKKDQGSWHSGSRLGGVRGVVRLEHTEGRIQRGPIKVRGARQATGDVARARSARHRSQHTRNALDKQCLWYGMTRAC